MTRAAKKDLNEEEEDKEFESLISGQGGDQAISSKRRREN